MYRIKTGCTLRDGLLVAAIAIAIAMPAAAQLTKADIDALRARGEAEGWTFTVGETPATQRPVEALHGFRLPPDWKPRGRWVMLREGDLPSRFDWRDYGGVTPVKDQQSCGSCWAFASAAIVEASWKIQTGDTLDISEQWLVSCNTDDYSYNCIMGGFLDLPLDMMSIGGQRDRCTKLGPVLESAFPYVSYDAPCNCPYPNRPDLCVDGWAYVGNDSDVPDVAQIKQAIYDHGPVACGVVATSAFDAYTGGVFNACSTSPYTNHAVVLVGWDDNAGSNGVWIMKNSWNTTWGESGFMRIAYGCSRIGEAAAFVLGAFRDCNGNGIPDPDDITDGTSQDCNNNGMPDECEDVVAPEILANPVSGDYCIGERALLVVAAQGAAPLSYEWSKDGEVIPGATDNKLIIPALTEADLGEYQCTVRNGCGEATSAPATIGDAQCPPRAPKTCSPECETADVARTLDLSWEPCLRADGYDVYMGPLDSSLEKIGSTTEPQLAVSDLKYGQKYFWQVVAKNDTGETPGPVWWFRTEFKPIPKPSQPLVISPADGATDVPLDVTLQWQPAEHAEFYQVLIGTDPASPLAFVGSTKTVSYKPLELAPNTTYFWQVSASNQGVYTDGPVYSFTTAAPVTHVTPTTPTQEPNDAVTPTDDPNQVDDGTADNSGGSQDVVDDSTQPAQDRPALGVCPSASGLMLTLTIAGLWLTWPRRRSR